MPLGRLAIVAGSLIRLFRRPVPGVGWVGKNTVPSTKQHQMTSFTRTASDLFELPSPSPLLPSLPFSRFSHSLIRHAPMFRTILAYNAVCKVNVSHVSLAAAPSRQTRLDGVVQNARIFLWLLPSQLPT